MNLSLAIIAHKLRRLRFGLASLSSLALAIAVLAPATSAAPLQPLPPLPAAVSPSSCAAFAQKYFHSGLLAPTVHYTLASHTTHVGASLGVVSYSEGILRLTPSELIGLLEGDGQQRFSDRRFTTPGSLASQPFDPAATDSLGIELFEARSGLKTSRLGGEFILESWGFTRQTFNVEGCLDTNIVYGTVTTNNGDSLVSIALDELIVPSTAQG